MRFHGLLLAILFLTGAAAAQVRPIFDPDDFVDPRDHDNPVFISRLVLGAVRGHIDDYRPLDQDAGLLHLANSYYWRDFQFDYKRSEVRAENVNAPGRVQTCPCNPRLFFPTPPPADVTPDPPLPAAKDTLQIAWYHRQQHRDVGPSMMLRYRLSFSRQKVETVATFLDTDHVAGIFHGHERSLGFEAETHYRIGGQDLFGSLFVAHTMRSGTTDDRSQSEVAYMSRFPGRAIGPLLVRATFTVGGVTSRGANGLNIVNPAFEAFWHEPTTDANFHLIWSPLAMRDGKGWTTHHQIAITVDRALWIHLFSSPAVAVHDLH